MTGKLILTHGIPGSGKSTWAVKEVAQDPKNRVRVNRDDIRTALLGEEYHKGKPNQKAENRVTQVQQELIKNHFANGKTVYCDDTNINTSSVSTLAALAKEHGAEVEQQYFDTPVEECKKRNVTRGGAGGRLVPDHVIDGMAAKAYDDDGHIKEFIIGEKRCFAVSRQTPGMKLLSSFNTEAEKNYPFKGKAVVFLDIDGTLANNNHHAAYAFGREGKKKDFPYFYKSIEHAPVNETVRNLANNMRNHDGLNIVVLTGRDDSHAKELLTFIKASDVKISRVITKREGDFRPDNEFKHEQLQRLKAEGLIPVHSIDDRPQSIAVWEQEGLMVSRVDFIDPIFNPHNREPMPEPTLNTIYGSGHCIRCGSALKNGGNIGPTCARKG